MHETYVNKYEQIQNNKVQHILLNIIIFYCITVAAAH